MPNSPLLEQIEADIAEAERLIAELRFHIALTQSAGADTSESGARLHRMMMVAMLLRDQRLKAAAQGPIVVKQSKPETSVLSPSPTMPEPEKPNSEKSSSEDQP